MARIRSPNYPAISLKEAIDRIKLFFDKAQTRLISREQAAEAMGYDGLHGASLSAISAALKYGLLEKVDTQVKLSDRAMSIIAPHNDEERQTAIHEAAFNPSLFGEIHERFLGDIPNDDKLRSFLIRKNFSSSALDRIIRSYRETMELVTESGGKYTDEPTLGEVLGGASEMDTAGSVTVVGGRQQPPPRGTPFRVALDGDAIEGTFRLTTPEEVDKLVKILQLNKIMITTVYEAIATEYTDDEKGRKAEQRDRERDEELGGSE